MCRMFFNLLIVAVISTSVLLLSACGPTEEPGDDTYNDPNDGSYVEDFANDYGGAPEGWRAGTLKISIAIDQAGALEETSAASGGTRTFIEWRFTLDAEQILEVEIAPDLSQLLPVTDNPETLRSAYASSPIYFDELKSIPAPRGRVTYLKRLTAHTPNANDFRSISEATDGTGVINGLSIRNLQPSFYGRGYEVDLDLSYSMLLNNLRTTEPLNGATIVEQTQGEAHEERSLALFPVPLASVFNSYPFEVIQELPPELRDAERQTHESIFNTLEQVAAGTQPLGDLRTGLRWQATKDELRLSYSPPPNAELPFFGDLTGLATPINPNMLRIEIVINAK